MDAALTSRRRQSTTNPGLNAHDLERHGHLDSQPSIGTISRDHEEEKLRTRKEPSGVNYTSLIDSSAKMTACRIQTRPP